MATQEYRIVYGEKSDVHDEPHIRGSRITFRDVHTQIEQRGVSPERVAERYSVDIAEVYEALAYYHSNPEEMQPVENRHQRGVFEAKQRSSLAPPKCD